jgi:methionyl-tRNA formyltransferase
MRILLLGKNSKKLKDYLSDNVLYHTDDKLTRDYLKKVNPNYIISYGYQYIISNEIVENYQQRIINLHISLLPWNKGADPNLWSFLENTPKGVTIHYIDSGLDTGNIISQKPIIISNNSTLKTSYDKLSAEIENLFKETWPKIFTNQLEIIKQPTGGSFHKSKDKQKYLYLLTEGWNTRVNKLVGKALNKGE